MSEQKSIDKEEDSEESPELICEVLEDFCSSIKKFFWIAVLFIFVGIYIYLMITQKIS